MELILINPSKLKIMLSFDDMQKYDLDTKTIDYDNTATRKAFWSILDDARQITGFDAASARLFIQLYQSKKGGCEMFVTKIGPFDCNCIGDENEKMTLATRRELPAAPLPNKTYGDRDRISAYVFEALDLLICVCRRLLGINWKGKSLAYMDGEGKCYLLLSHPTLYTYEAPLDELSFINEYGRSENADMIKLYVKEYAHPICQGSAISTLGVL